MTHGLHDSLTVPVGSWLGDAWVSWFLLWLVLGWVWRKRTILAESGGALLLRSLAPLLAVVVIGIALQALHPGLLDRRVFTTTSRVRFAGFVLTCLGLLLTFWPRIVLGRNWSGRITLKEDHELVTRGPYRHIRHPIYTFLLLALLGTALVSNTVLWYLVLAAIVVGLVLKAKREESYLTNFFGASYRDYRERTGFLLPRFSRRR